MNNLKQRAKAWLSKLNDLGGSTGVIEQEAYALLQELVDAPEAEPVAWLFHFNNGETSLCGNKAKAEAIIKQLGQGETAIRLYSPAEPPADVARDAERLDWLERESKASRTGVSIAYTDQTNDESLLKRGYRLMRYHQIFSAHSTLREAIDAAREQEGGE